MSSTVLCELEVCWFGAAVWSLLRVTRSQLWQYQQPKSRASNLHTPVALKWHTSPFSDYVSHGYELGNYHSKDWKPGT